MQLCDVLLVRSDHCGWTDLRRVVEAMPNLRLVGQSLSAVHARQLAAQLRPDLVISDKLMGQPSILPLLTEIRTMLPECRLMIVGPTWDAEELSKLAALGVAGHLLWKDLTANALRHVLAILTTNTLSSQAATSQPRSRPLRRQTRRRSLRPWV